uniref:A-kinase anchor protein 9 n=1 Tax=Magallana gigas TaxID=29159 RepID=K1Q7T1_MAGGI
METTSTPCKIHQCSKCPGDTEYYCVSCPCDLCPQCKENHVKDLQTIDHDVVSHRDKINYIPTQEVCVRHPSHVYIKYCEPCELPVCFHCTQHKEHTTLDVRTIYKTKRQQHRGTIHTIRSEALFYRPVLLPRIKTDFKTCRTEYSLYQSEMLTKAQTLKHLIDYIQKDFMCNVFCDFDFKHRCLKQQKEIIIHIVSLQRYVYIYEQRRVIRPLQFLSSIKTALPHMHPTLHTSQLSMTESLNKEDVMESLSAIQITERGNRRVGNQSLLKLTSGTELHQSLTLTGVDRCHHISCVTSDRVWVSDGRNNLILTDTTGVPLHHVEDLYRDLDRGGLHTVNSESELIYIDRNNDINKLSKDMKTTTTFIKRTYSTWKPLCVYLSPSTGDLLVGMCYNSINTNTGKVTRYTQSGQLTQTIQHDKTGRGLYSRPLFITENNNGDVVVSDYTYIPKSGAVVVTKCGGRYCFSYTGHPSGSVLLPCGICTDALSHILVCDDRTNTVQMLDKDGQFLSHLLTKSREMGEPWSLSYDVNTHRLWVGSRHNRKVCVYRYITRQDALKDKSRVMESLSGILTPGTENPQQGNQCLLKLMSLSELLHSLTVTGVDRCYHISCVTSDRVWVSDISNLILTDTTGVPLHRVEDLCRGLFGGSHTVNSESELIYIDRNYNINKLSKDMKTTTTFIETTDSTWRPQCVYWSPSTGDLLVGMCYIITKTGKVTRYNQSGQLTQTIQNDNTGRELYSIPYYITENNNGDVVVSDLYGAVVVTERRGRHRFSYTGRPSGSGLRPRGICTDPLSHILVCNGITYTLQMLDKDGQFLSHLLTKSQEMGRPRSLSYDVNTHRLLVGSLDNNKVCVYRYITRQDALTEIQRLTQRVLDLEDQVSETREREMESTRKLQQEKQRSTHQQVDSEGSEEDPITGMFTKLSLRSDTVDSLTCRPSAQAVNQRVLHHNSELTNFVSRLTEEKMELRNTLGRLEEKIWRYRQRGTEQQSGHDTSENHADQENRHLEACASWTKERLSLQLALYQMEQEFDQCRADIRVERNRMSGITRVGTERDRDRLQEGPGLPEKVPALVTGGFQDCEQALIARMGVYASPEELQRGTRPRRPVTAFRSASRVVVAVTRNSLARKAETYVKASSVRIIFSSSSPTPTKVCHSTPARRVRISEPSSHDDYISRLENLQQRLSGMDSGE